MANSVITKPVKKSQKTIKKKNKYKNFNLVFLSCISSLMLTVGFFNYVIDPYGVFNAFYLPKFNDVKPKKYLNDRLYRAIEIIKIKPKTLIIGSSRVTFSINPENASIVNNTQKPIYNLGLSSPTIYEIKRYLEHALANQKDIDTILLGIDFFMFDENKKNIKTFEENRLEQNHIELQDVFNSLLSFDAIGASWETIKNSQEMEIKKGYGDNGFYPFDFYGYKMVLPWAVTKTKEDSFIIDLNNYLKVYKNYQISVQQFQYFQEIINICRDNNIKIIVFIPPVHSSHYEGIISLGKRELLEKWQRRIVKIAPVFDFSGYNSITTEKIHTSMQNYYETSHSTEKVGNLILNRIFAGDEYNIHSDFGALITEDNIESHLSKIRQDREIWKKNNHQDWQLVETIRQQQESSLESN